MSYIKESTPKSKSFQLFHTEKLQVFALRASELKLISYVRLDGRKEFLSVKSAWSVLYGELKVRFLPHSRGITNKDTYTHTQTHTHTHTHTPIYIIKKPISNCRISFIMIDFIFILISSRRNLFGSEVSKMGNLIISV